MNNQQKQQVIEQVKSANNVLITVSTNPTVDELSASVGLTLALNKLGKHATTVFSGVVPSTIEFLQPEQTIETTTDSLRDFIIALDKSKADKLRYKVEDDVVRIFITPYKTTITDRDLQFSHGDFNVDVVVALGVTRKEDIDRAVTAHGRILHDATVMSITRDVNSELGSINWQDPQASSLCEMVGSMTLEIQQDVLDGQMATAFLTGIIAETDRFRNQKTTPLALSLSSQLMSSGANQQLIADKLEEPAPPPMPIHKQDEATGSSNSEASQDGTLSIDHDEVGDNPDEDGVDRIHIDDQGNIGAHPDDTKLGSQEGSDATAVADKDIPQAGSSGEMPVMNHEKKIITPPSEEGKVKTDKPFDLNAAIKAAEEEGAPAEYTSDENSELPEVHTQEQPPKIIQDHSGPMLTEDPTAKVDEGIDSAIDSHSVDEAPSGAPTPSPAEAAEHQVPQPHSAFEKPKDEIKPDTVSEAVEESQESLSDEQTLSQLEKAVESPHQDITTVDNARDAVARAADSQEPSYPKPAESIGASNVDLQKVADEVVKAEPDPSTDDKKPEVVDPTAPPPVPPPMTTPQFFDADGNNQNPFLNPNAQ